MNWVLFVAGVLLAFLAGRISLAEQLPPYVWTVDDTSCWWQVEGRRAELVIYATEPGVGGGSCFVRLYRRDFRRW